MNKTKLAAELAALGLMTKKQTAALANRARTLALFGDSHVERYNGTSAAGTISQSAGIATAVISSHGRAVGDVFKINLASDAKYNVVVTALTVADSSHFTFACDPTAGSATGAYIVFPEQISGRSAFGWINGLLDSRYTVVANSGVGGDTSDGMLARIATDVLAYLPAECWMVHGTNDIYASAFTTAKIKANDLVLWGTLIAAGIFVREFSIPPHTSTTTAQRQQILEINRWRKEYWAGNPCGAYHDSYSPIVTGTTGAGRSNVLIDSVHHSNLGAQMIAVSVAPGIGTSRPALSGFTSSQLDSYITSSTSRQLFSNPMMVSGVQTAGTPTSSTAAPIPTGTVADLMNVNIDAGASTAVVCSIVARTVAADGDDFGNNQVMVITSTANQDKVSLNTNETMTSRATNGDRLHAEISVTVVNPQNLRTIRLTNLLQTATTGNLFGIDGGQDTTTDPIYPNGVTFTRTFRTPITAIRTPSGTHGALSSLKASLVMEFAGAGGATVSAGKLGIIKEAP